MSPAAAPRYKGVTPRYMGMNPPVKGAAPRYKHSRQAKRQIC